MKNFNRFSYLGGLLALSACSQWGFEPGDLLGGGHSPPAPSVLPPLPEPPAPPVQNNCEGQFQSFDDVYEILQNDLFSQDADDRPFTRYLSLTDRFNEGVCSEDLAADRLGLSKALQMVSIASAIQVPFAVDSNETLYRVDVRDYDWDREITVNGVVFDDGWEAMLAQNPFAIEFEGDEADTLKDLAETSIPWVSAGSFVSTATRGALYYGLIDVDVSATLDDFILDDLGIDVVANFDENEVVRAAHLIDAANNEARIAERHSVEFRLGYLWWEHRGPFESTPGLEGLVDDPFLYPDAGSTVVFSLPNQFMAFIVADENANIVNQGEPRFELASGSSVAPTPLSLAAQHSRGFPVIEDEVRSDVEENRFNFNGDDFEAVQDIYPRPDEFAAIQASDFGLAALAFERIGGSTAGPEPVNGVVQSFAEDLSLARLAAELGVTSRLLEANLGLLDPVFDNAVTVPTPRATVESEFLDAICIMQSFSENRPANCL